MSLSNSSWRSTICPELHLIHLKNVPIFEQLQLEEALLRTDTRNFCIINEGSQKAIVMGISGKVDALINTESVQKAKIPMIRRFSGGGTVIVDKDTLFISFIMGKNALDIAPFPEPILRWSEALYLKAWPIAGFHLRENDYCIQDRKCGGNAQYITKERWIHHTSFLWDYQEENMQHLLMPEKRPQYRSNREHSAFLTRLKEHIKDKSSLIEGLKGSLGELFALKEKDPRQDVKRLYIDLLGSMKPHRKATVLVKK